MDFALTRRAGGPAPAHGALGRRGADPARGRGRAGGRRRAAGGRRRDPADAARARPGRRQPRARPRRPGVVDGRAGDRARGARPQHERRVVGRHGRLQRAQPRHARADRALPASPTLAGERADAYAVTERDAGSDAARRSPARRSAPRAATASAPRSGSSPTGDMADYFIVMVNVVDGDERLPTLFLVDRDAPGITFLEDPPFTPQLPARPSDDPVRRARCRRTPCWAARTRSARAASSRTRGSSRSASTSPRAAWARCGGCSTRRSAWATERASSSASRSSTSRASASRSPTPRPTASPRG